MILSFQKFFVTFIIISEELNYQFVFPLLPIFQSYICTIPIYLYIYRISYFDLIGSSSVK